MYSHLKVDIAWGPGHDISPLIQPEGHDQCHHHHLHDAIRRKPPSSQLIKCLGLICRITCGLDTADFCEIHIKTVSYWYVCSYRNWCFFKVMGLVMGSVMRSIIGLSWGQPWVCILCPLRSSQTCSNTTALVQWCRWFGWKRAIKGSRLLEPSSAFSHPIPAITPQVRV